MGLALRHAHGNVADGRQKSHGRSPALGRRSTASFSSLRSFPQVPTSWENTQPDKEIHGLTHSRWPSIPKYAHSFTLERRALSMETSCGEGLETFDALWGSSFYFDDLAPASIRPYTLCYYDIYFVTRSFSNNFSGFQQMGQTRDRGGSVKTRAITSSRCQRQRGERAVIKADGHDFAEIDCVKE